MAFIFGGAVTPKTTQSAAPPAYNALRVQQSSFGVPVKIVYGTTRVGGNLLWYDDFESIAHSSGGGGGGGGSGKGGGGGGGSGGGGTTSYTYKASLLIGLGRGTIHDIGQVWKGKSPMTLAELGDDVAVLTGTADQAPWGYLTSKHPDKALGYSGLACVGIGGADLGDSADTPNYGFEMIGLGSTGGDINFAWMTEDLLLSTSYGISWPAGRLGDFDTYAAWCVAAGLEGSIAIEEATTAADIMDNWLRTTSATFAWSGAKLKVVVLADSAVGAFTPDLTPKFVFTDDDYVVDNPEDPPVTRTFKDPADVDNQQPFEYLERSDSYNIATVTAEDPAMIASFGPRPAAVVKTHHFTSAAVAMQAAALLRDRVIYIEPEQLKCKVGSQWVRIEPGDIGALNDSQIGLVNFPVRLTRKTEDASGNFAIEAEPCPGAVSVIGAMAIQAATRFQPNFNVAPGPVSDAILFEPPPVLTVSGLEVWVLVCGGPNWGGCEVWISSDDSHYERIGATRGNATIGVLTTTLSAGGDPDAVNTLNIDLSESRGQLLGGTKADADGLHTLAVIEDELVSYETATLTGSNRYGLSYLRRGAYDTSIASHPPGARFGRLDGNFYFAANYTPDQFGKTVYVKLVSFNQFGGAIEDIATVTGRPYRIKGTALLAALPVVTGLATAYVAGIINLTWGAVSDYRSPVDYEIRMGATPDTAQVIGRTPLLQAPSYGNGTYWIAAHYSVPNGPEVYSSAWTSVVVTGAQLVSNVIASFDEAATGWSGSLTNAMVAGGAIQPAGGGDILSCPDFFGITDFFMYGGPSPTAAYTVPVGHRVTLTAPAACPVLMSAAVRGQSLNGGFFAITDFFSVTDVFEALLGPKVSATPQIRLSQDGSTWSAWQDWVPGTYVAKSYDFRVVVTTSDPAVLPILTGFTFSVDVPDRVDSFSVALSAGSPTAITYANGAFNGSKAGPGQAPQPQVTIIGASAGDDLVITNVTLSGLTASVVNAGAVVARTLSVLVQGF